jgi:hypothetical protein
MLSRFCLGVVKAVSEDRRTWGDTIKMDLKENNVGVADWINLAQDRDQWWAVINVDMILRFL